MKELQAYGFNFCDKLEPNEGGEWALYDDCLRIVEAVKKEEAGLAELEIGKLKKEIEILKYRFGEL